MKETALIIHCGTHKTATSAFQYTCYRNHSTLLRSGILYPKIKKIERTIHGREILTQHSIVARSLSANKSSYAENFFKQARIAMKKNNCHILLLSGEDFENILVDSMLLEKLITLSRNIGLGSPKLIFTIREPMQYFCSMYSELSKKQVLIDFKSAAIAAANTGFFACPAPANSLGESFGFNGFYAINTKGLVKRLSSRFRNLSITSSSFESFIHPSPGHKFLSQLLSKKTHDLIDFGTENDFKNARLDDLQVEVNYAESFLGVGHNISGQYIDAIARKRLETRKNVEPFVKELFDRQFAET